ncbi:MAG: hypothetical protein Q8930_07285 [Bacillota bacterium]|nr:hypothetical protein [Bacillota bacterium]
MICGWKGKLPGIDTDTYITEGTYIVGDVTLGPDCSIWYGAVLRGDDNSENLIKLRILGKVKIEVL